EVHLVGLSASAVLLAVGEAEQAGAAKGADQVPRELGALLVIGCLRRDLIARELADQGEQIASLLGGKDAVDRHPQPPTTSRSRSIVSSRSTPSSVTTTMSSIRAP